MIRLLVLSLSLAGCGLAQAGTPTKEPTVATAPSFSDLTLTKLDGSPMPATEFAGKAVLVVNVASKCGFTPQYEGLQKLHETYSDKGLVIVGQPCNQFGGQEPGSAEQIESFCKMNYGVTFPLLEKADVNGKDRAPLYDFLVQSEAGGGADIKWNFEKFVIGTDGKVAARFGSRTTPTDADLIKAIEAALPQG